MSCTYTAQGLESAILLGEHWFLSMGKDIRDKNLGASVAPQRDTFYLKSKDRVAVGCLSLQVLQCVSVRAELAWAAETAEPLHTALSTNAGAVALSRLIDPHSYCFPIFIWGSVRNA